MSNWLEDIGSAIGTGVDWLFGSDTGKLVLNIGGTALAGYALSQLTDSTKTTDAATEPDKGVRIQIGPSPYNKIPVIYGSAVTGGTITDLMMSDDHLTMYFCFALCEQTGKLDVGRGADSQISFEDIYWDDKQVVFNADGFTVAGFKGSDQKVNADPAGLIQIYTFSNGSSNPVKPNTIVNAKNTAPAYSVFPKWTPTDMMSNLVFAIVKVTYSKAKNITSVGNIKFKIKNSLTEPGDVLYDYMTNPLYGASILPGIINL